MQLSTVLFQDIPERLTTTQRELLKEMASAEDAENYEDAEIVCQGIECWIASRRVSWRTVKALLCCVLISEEGDHGVYRYTINGSGREVLKDDGALARIREALLSGSAVGSDGRPIDV